MNNWNNKVETIGALIIIAIVVAVLIIVCNISPAGAEGEISFPNYWEHNSTLVTYVQETLNEHGENVTVDGKFGAKTAQAVKNVQKRYGLTPTGVVDDDFAYRFSVANWPYGQDYTLYYMANLEKAYDRGEYEDMIYIALGGRSRTSEFALFRDGLLAAETLCITGNETKGNYTPVGEFTVWKKSKVRETDSYSYYWQLWLKDRKGHCLNIAIHSLLCYPDSRDAKGGQELGDHLSNGCIRVPNDLAEWLYQNIQEGTIVVIDDRAFQPSSIGYQTLIENTTYADWD